MFFSSTNDHAIHRAPNPIGSDEQTIVQHELRKVIKTRSSFPTDEAVSKLFYLALKNIGKTRTMPIRDWKAALNRFTIQFDERMLPG